MDLDQFVKLICEASIEPVLICSQTKILNCNDSFVEAIGKFSKTEIMNSSLDNLTNEVFLPKLRNIGNTKNKIDINKIAYVKIVFKGTSFSVPVKITEWIYREERYFTLSTREVNNIVSVNRLTQNKQLCENCSRLPKKEIVAEKKFEELKLIADALPCVVWSTDTSGEQIFVNDAYEKIFNLKINQNWEDIYHPNDVDYVVKKFKDCLKNGKLFEVECLMRKSPRTTNEECPYRWYINRAKPVYIPNTNTIERWIGTITDIHDMKMALEEKQKLILSEKAAKEASRIKSEFLAVMSHELRTPLFGVIGSASILADFNLNPEQTSLVDTIYSSANLLLMLIQDILDFSKIETGKLSIIPSYFDLSRMLKDVELITSISAQKKDISFKITKPNADYKLYGDFNRILQIFNNLISNGIKFTKRGGVYVKVLCEENASDREEILMKVSVEDTGSGISKETSENLFKPWIQENGNMKFMGSGLGLYICKNLLNSMNGKIGLERTKTGTLAWFEVPLKTTKKETGRKPSIIPILTPLKIPKINMDFTSNQEKINFENINVLVAEDNEINQKIICKFLSKLNIRYDVASDGEQALTIYNYHKSNHYKIILMDQSMPKYSGDYVSEKIKQKNKDQIIISISANVFIKSSAEIHKHNIINDYISKPFTFAKFSSTLHKWLQPSPTETSITSLLPIKY